MKKILLLLTLFSFNLSAYSQSLIAENKEWYIGESFITQPPITFILKMEGDTIVDGKEYKRIYNTRDTINQIWTQSNQLIREDSSKKVWIRNYSVGQPEEMLLYDFNLVVGDSFAINLDGDFMCKIPVINVDSIVLSNGELRKRITFSFQLFGDIFEEVYWIEGIGSQFGLITHLYGYCEWIDFGRWLRCYFEDGERVYGQVPEDECFRLITSTADLESPTSFSVFPNPAMDQLNLTLPGAESRHWEIFNYQGQVALKGKVDNRNHQISIRNLSSGIYFLKIENLGIQKLMVQ